jgi:hypothetical protein
VHSRCQVTSCYCLQRGWYAHAKSQAEVRNAYIKTVCHCWKMSYFFTVYHSVFKQSLKDGRSWPIPQKKYNITKTRDHIRNLPTFFSRIINFYGSLLSPKKPIVSYLPQRITSCPSFSSTFCPIVLLLFAGKLLERVISLALRILSYPVLP